MQIYNAIVFERYKSWKRTTEPIYDERESVV